jgi:hypothetical protein
VLIEVALMQHGLQPGLETVAYCFGLLPDDFWVCEKLQATPVAIRTELKSIKA